MLSEELKLGGKIPGTDVLVDSIAVEIVCGTDVDEIAATYPGVTGADIRAVREWILLQCGIYTRD